MESTGDKEREETGEVLKRIDKKIKDQEPLDAYEEAVLITECYKALSERLVEIRSH